MEDNKFEVLTGRMQIIKRPTMWVGAVDPSSKEMFILSEDKAEHKQIEYIPAFKKIIDEILDNALDALIVNNNSTGTIKVKMDESSVKIEDDGPGIPVVNKKLSEIELKNLPKEEAKELQNTPLPVIAWSRLFSGTNFQDSDNKTTIGSHGIGSKATAIFSKKFIGISDDGKKKCIVKAFDNLEKSTHSIENTSGSSGVTVEFWPDLAYFKLEKIDEIYQQLMYQRLLCLAITFPKIKFFFNNHRIYGNDKKFLKLFSENIEFVSFDKGFIGVFPNDKDDFNFFSYVNGMHMTRGGSHVEYVAYQLVNPIREKLSKKYKTIKPADIKNKLTVVCFLRDFANPKFDSQTKETLTNSVSEVSSFFGDKVDFQAFAKQILKNDAIIEPIVDMFKLKEELKARSELKKIKKVKVRSDKYMSPIGAQKYLFLCEGASAQASLAGCLGRNGFGYYACRGLPINAVGGSIQRIAANQEFKDVMNLLELDITKDAKDKTIAFERIVIACDQDLDGTHLSSMLIGWFRRFAPNLFNEGKVCKLQTPLVIVKDNKDNIKEYFYTLDSFKDWEKKNKNTKLNIIYQKGLGSMERADIDWLVANTGGIDNLIYELNEDAEAFKNVDLWLTGDAAPRKEKLYNYTFDINSI